jgi:hypothetical protein
MLVEESDWIIGREVTVLSALGSRLSALGSRLSGPLALHILTIKRSGC